ncbi:MAG TPA: hypothetical protein VE399_04585 [Gemmatimonadales bacterium]|nr:hypothetical protein [Gemmatimonadales bacterium]
MPGSYVIGESPIRLRRHLSFPILNWHWGGRCSTLSIALLLIPGWLAQGQAPDSLQILRNARDAQREFERNRKAHLSYDWDNRSGFCDLRVGRFCYWYDASPDRPPEPEAIGRARTRLLRTLAAAGAELPGDDWILGQRVRYLVEDRRAGLAVTLTQECPGTRWWCDALEGFARHAGGDYEGADQAFELALTAMPEKQRCAWTDLSPLLKDARQYRKLACGERLARSQRIWWLADPLYSVAGNDLRTEHYSRHTMALLLEDAANPYGISWSDDMRELLVRFGWPTHWARSYLPGSLESPRVVGHERDPSFWLFPRPVLTDPWFDVTAVRWEPMIERPPARYAPTYATGLVPITGVQFARFRRGDTTVTIAALVLKPDSVFAGGTEIRLAVARDPATPMEVGRASPAGRYAVASVRSRWRPRVLSLETMRPSMGPVGRWRVIVPPDPAGLAPDLSDILLVAPAPAGELPSSLGEAAAAALRPTVVRAGHRVGLYWEMYDTSYRTDTVQVAITVTKARSQHEAPYPVGRPECPPRVASPVTVRWQEEPGTAPRNAARSIALDLRPLSRGRYVVAVQISEAGRTRGCSSRELQIVE